MSTVILGAGVVTLAGLTMVLVRRRIVLFGDDTSAWLKTTVGFVFFGLTLLLLFLEKLGLSGDVPVFASAICLAGGTVFSLAGLAVWIPKVLRSHSRAERQRTLAELVDSIRRICDSRMPASQVVEEVMSLAFHKIRPLELIYMRWEDRRNLLKPVCRYPHDAVPAAPAFSMIEENSWLRDVILELDSTRRTAGRDTHPSLDGIPFSIPPGALIVALPVAAKGRLLGVTAMAFACEQSFENEDTAILRTAMNCLADALDTDYLRESYEHFAHIGDAHTRLMRIALDCESVADLLAAGIRQFRSFVPFDMLSVSVLDANATGMKRYSFMESGNRVSERGLSLPVHGSAVEYVAKRGEGSITGRLTGMNYHDDCWLAKCGFGSRLSIPVIASGKVVGVVSYVSTMDGGFDQECMNRAELLSDVFAVAINNSLVREKLRRWSDHIRDSWRLLAHLVSGGGTEEFFRVFAKQVASSMPVTCCTVSLYEQSTRSLRVLAEHSLRGTRGARSRREKDMLLDRMPHHLSVVLSGKPLTVDNEADSNDRMSIDEIESVFPDRARSAMICPITVRGVVRGIMSLGEARDPRRRPFGSEDLSFAEMRATQASLALAIEESRVDLKSATAAGDIEPVSEFVLDTLSDMSRKMAGPLSSIIGAAELLERKLPRDGSGMTGCVGIIRRNTGKVMRVLENFRELRHAVS